MDLLRGFWAESGGERTDLNCLINSICNKSTHKVNRRIDMVKKVLIIDDDSGDRELIREYLLKQSSDIDFTMAENGEQGVDEVNRSKPDLVVLDLNMPGIDGFETCKRIKDIDKDLKVVILTGFSDTINYNEREDSTAELYLTKDFMKYTLPKVFQRIYPSN